MFGEGFKIAGGVPSPFPATISKPQRRRTPDAVSKCWNGERGM
jgi:hypothetical protein